MGAPEPLPTEEEADRFFTEVPPARSGRPATTGPPPALAPARKPFRVVRAALPRWSRLATTSPTTGVAPLQWLGLLVVIGLLAFLISRISPAAPSTAAAPSISTASAVASEASADETTADETAFRKNYLGNTDVGTCYESLPVSAMNFVMVLPCDDPGAHFLVRKEFPLTEDLFTDEKALARETDALCRAFLADGGPEPDRDTYGIVVPTADEWAEGYTSGYCLVRLRP